MIWLNVPVFASFLLYLLTVARKRGFLTVDALFAYFQLVLVVGTFPQLDAGQRSDVVYGYVLAYCFTAYTLVCVLVHAITPRPQGIGLMSGSARIVVTRMSPRMWSLIGISVAITLLYYAVVGYSALVVGLRAQLSGGNAADIATLRLNSYSGARYLAPGYVNQFKNALLPALVVLAITYFTTTRFRHRILIGVLVLLTLFGVLGTGQRGAFVLVIVMLIVYLYFLDRSRFRHRLVAAVAFGLAVSALATFALGRSSAKVAAAHGVTGKVGVVFNELWSRITQSNQASGVAGFRYTYGLPTQWGREWAQGLVSLLPGPFKARGPSLDNLIFASLYGDTRGTSPPSLWGSIYYNFGLLGIVVAPIALAIIFRRLADGALGRSTYTTLELVGIAGTFACLGSWVAGGPNVLANTGTLTFVIIWIVGRRASRRAEAQTTGEPAAVRAHPVRPISGPPVSPQIRANGSRRQRANAGAVQAVNRENIAAAVERALNPGESTHG